MLGGICMDKILNAGDYGVCLFSLEMLQDFLKRKRVRTKKLLDKFQQNKELYLDMLREGIWVPFVPINMANYVIKLEGQDAPFNGEWEKKLEYGGFNLEIKDVFWISGLSSFENFKAEEYTGGEGSYATIFGGKSYYSADEIYYDLPGQRRIYTDFRYTVPSGKYLLSIKGYVRKELLEHPGPNYGFSFALEKVEEFDGFNAPREDDIYDFNVAEM